MHGLCENWIDDRQLLNCPAWSTHFHLFCIFNESVSWVEHRDKCFSAGGILLSYSNEHMMFLMEANISYTMGMFRTFTPIPKQAQRAAFPCLAVTRVRNELWLEPEDCAAKRRYLCNTEHTFDYYPKETSSTYFDEETITSESTESDAKRRDMCNQTIIILLALISGFAIITVIVLGVCLKRSCRMNSLMHSYVATKTYEDLQSRNTAGDYSTVQETGMKN
ncbi:hypothetical protein DPMN_077035 [Dreissena polymorpha]|uniref:C-type lectin domain-containing protein n=1 Tax=Dreissena polymorpha TaxID=45954 RepID=A0A9D3YNG9_DREPO|nr:hypothetical protein DPMN_077035 [Dreissena polymorpha]